MNSAGAVGQQFLANSALSPVVYRVPYVSRGRTSSWTSIDYLHVVTQEVCNSTGKQRQAADGQRQVPDGGSLLCDPVCDAIPSCDRHGRDDGRAAGFGICWTDWRRAPDEAAAAACCCGCQALQGVGGWGEAAASAACAQASIVLAPGQISGLLVSAQVRGRQASRLFLGTPRPIHSPSFFASS